MIDIEYLPVSLDGPVAYQVVSLLDVASVK